ncbi:hypothetical protein BCV69DRAFT_213970 [Microstroma glucosiphilum]|uniref:Response regulatory domain-containing protein n=1 Tax=Pseudomicrostroma glucosiphilum TaxID=1684307 RepID=A0A316U405_9BASI|nr:hypothetical protein BCV69DRAFT_213970 [Pseudomicrostroma glucosiphilum]PWN19947.1 hypothetical protein BCV69DRAFT_213970 [Pseudomicrostroma glucosiphilum]
MASYSTVSQSPSSSSRSPPPLPSVPLTVQPPSPDESITSPPAGPLPPMASDAPAMASPSQPLARRPMNRSISIPLAERMGALRHPRPRMIAKTSEPDFTAVGGSRSSSPPTPRSPNRRNTKSSLSASSSNLLASESSSSALAHLVLDTLQLPISHLLHIIPPHLLDASHETLSPTSLSMPVTSVEAVMEAFRSINWICDAFIEQELASSGKASSSAETLEDIVPNSDVDGGPSSRETITSLGPLKPLSQRSSSEAARASTSSTQQSEGSPTAASSSASPAPASFDLSELVQRAADVVSGQAADKAIDLVISLEGFIDEHDDSHSVCTSAIGDEGAVKCVLIHTLSRMLAVVPPHSTLTVGLNRFDDTKGKSKQGLEITPCSLELRLTSNGRDVSGVHELLERCLDDSVLNIAQAQSQWTHSEEPPVTSIVELKFQELGICSPDLAASAVPSTIEHEDRQRFLPRLALGEEPTAQELSGFVKDELKGKTVALHASDSSVFAQHLAQLLQDCGCHVSSGSVAPTGSSMPSTPIFGAGDKHHLPAARTAIAITEGRPAFIRYSTSLALAGDCSSSNATAGPAGPSSSMSGTAILDPVTGVPLTLPREEESEQGEDHKSSRSVTGMERDSSSDTIKSGMTSEKLEAYSFVMVDDDIETLQRELLRLRSALPLLRGALGQGTPSAQHLHRSAKDGFPLRPGNTDQSHASKPPLELTHAIVYFTSLKNFRSIRDVLQPIMESAIQALGEGQAYTLPEILVVPKPAGPRRILTALKTAMHKPIVDPFFAPIATSPMSPYLWEAKIGKREGSDQRDVTSPEADLSSITSSLTVPDSASRRSAKRKDGSLKLSNLPRPDPKTVLGVDAVAAHETKSNSPSSTKTTTEIRPSLLPLATPSVRSSQGSSSPLPAETLEYFSETAARMGTSAASGLVIQSPDGRPAALYFDPNLSGSGSIRGSQGRRAGSVSGPSSNRSFGSRISDTPNLLASARRQSEERHSYHHPSIADVMAGKKETNDDTDGIVSADQSRRNSDQSVSSFASRLTTFGDAPPGTLFAPQVGIDYVLSSGKPPVATPIASQPAVNEGEDPLMPIVSSPPNVTGDAPGSEKSDNQPAAEQKATLPSRTTLPATSTKKAPSARSSALGSKKASPVVPTASLDAGPVVPPRAQEASQGETAGEADGAVRGVHPSFAALSPATKPSAQPQTGLLIGAGFAPSGRRGGGPKKTQVREKVLPPIQVLIVEDNPINQKILKQFMTRKKIKFDTAVNGREAVDKWATGGFHLILMDIQLPVMDGIEATKEIRKQELMANVGQLPATPPVHTAGFVPGYVNGLVDMPAPSSAAVPPTPLIPSGSSVPQTPFRASVIIVALTASVLNSDRVAALAAGCNDFLNKPVSLPWLEKKIIEWGSMQYILLSGAGVFDAERRAQRSLFRGQGAAAAAASSSDVRRGFGSNPDAQAKLLASKLYLPTPKKRRPGLPPSPRSAAKVQVLSTAAGERPASTDSPGNKIAGGGNIQVGRAFNGMRDESDGDDNEASTEADKVKGGADLESAQVTDEEAAKTKGTDEDAGEAKSKA